MARRSTTHALLALLLLVSQQMAIVHVMSHWTGRISGVTQAGAVVNDEGLSQAIAQDKSCAQCLAFAQIASGIGHTPRSFALPPMASYAVASAAERGCTPRTMCVFRSRAPPAVV